MSFWWYKLSRILGHKCLAFSKVSNVARLTSQILHSFLFSVISYCVPHALQISRSGEHFRLAAEDAMMKMEEFRVSRFADVLAWKFLADFENGL